MCVVARLPLEKRQGTLAVFFATFAKVLMDQRPVDQAHQAAASGETMAEQTSIRTLAGARLDRACLLRCGVSSSGRNVRPRRRIHVCCSALRCVQILWPVQCDDVLCRLVRAADVCAAGVALLT